MVFDAGVRQRAAASGSISACAYNEIPGRPAVDEIARTPPIHSWGGKKWLGLEACAKTWRFSGRAECERFAPPAPRNSPHLFSRRPKKRERKQCNRRAAERDIALPHYFSGPVTSRGQNEKKCLISSDALGKNPQTSRALSVLISNKYLIGTTGADSAEKHSRC